jgi:predicted RNA methylase
MAPGFSTARSAFKALLPKEPAFVTLRFGLYRGLRLHIDFASQAQLYFGLDEAETHRVIRDALARARWMIDIGAGSGELSILFARKSAARVYAVEPGPVRERIAANMAANDLPGHALEIVPRCIGSQDGYLALDAIAVEHSAYGFVKIDIDGGEADALRTGPALIAARNCAFLIETHSASLEQDCIDILSGGGYACRVIRNAWWRRFIPERRPLAHNRWLSAVPR